MIDRVEMLLALVRNAQEDGDDLLRDHHRMGAAHAARLKELWTILEEARQILSLEIQRFQRYLPAEDRPADQRHAVSQGQMPRRIVEGKTEVKP